MGNPYGTIAILGMLMGASTGSVRAESPVGSVDTVFGGLRTLIKIGGRTGFVLQPLNPAPLAPPALFKADGNNPWVWYAPTFTGSLPNASCAWYLERFLKRGFWVAGIDVGESYGNPEGRKTFSAFYDTLMARYPLNPKACLMPQSRGGLMLYNWAAEPGNAAKVARIAGIYPVGDLRSYPGLAVAAPAYGMTEPELSATLKQHNPIDRLKPLAEHGIPILHLHGDSDLLVPLSANSQVIRDRYAALGGTMELIVRRGKGHAEIPEFFQSQDLLDFLLVEAQPVGLAPRRVSSRNPTGGAALPAGTGGQIIGWGTRIAGRNDLLGRAIPISAGPSPESIPFR